jgi:beta-lactamase superfamily II metal-dependent hydrolase
MVLAKRFTLEFGIALLCATGFCLSVILAGPADATPPHYKSFDRIQQINPPDLAPKEEWLEIWVFYIGQGDGMLIRLPESMNYDLNGTEERIDIIIDGGPGVSLRQVLGQLYPDGARLEHVVLSHHDSDHVSGLSKLIADQRFEVERVYHNGLVSWRRGVRGFPTAGTSPGTGKVFEATRGMALLEADNKTLRSQHLMGDLGALRAALNSEELAGVYEELGEAVDAEANSTLTTFEHGLRNGGFIGGAEGSRIGDDVTFTVLWPAPPQRRYRDWSYTINGNSLSFMLDYRDFSMLFAGDHNEDSEDHWLEHLDGDTAELEADVLKIPHHGSQHNAEAFFNAVNAVLGVASMGEKGFGPKWKHPSEEVIRWMGGPHRVYSTFIHERRFKYEDLADESDRIPFVETNHVLIQTDGHWFRIVEVKSPAIAIPDVTDVDRGDGTRWIRARE